MRSGCEVPDDLAAETKRRRGNRAEVPAAEPGWRAGLALRGGVDLGPAGHAGPDDLGEVTLVEVDLPHLRLQLRPHPVVAGRHAQRMVLRVAEQDVDELAADQLAGERREPV